MLVARQLDQNIKQVINAGMNKLCAHSDVMTMRGGGNLERGACGLSLALPRVGLGFAANSRVDKASAYVSAHSWLPSY